MRADIAELDLPRRSRPHASPAKAAASPCAFAAMVGRTPLIAIDLSLGATRATVYAKAEFLNFTGSIKDRMAASILLRARATGRLQPGQPIVEVTSGNAGIALAAMGTCLGHPVTIFMPDWMSQERRSLLTGFGARLELVSRAEGGFLGALDLAKQFAADHGAFQSSQFANPDNVAGHADGTGPELLAQLAGEGGAPDAFVAGVGTGGTVMGVAEAFRRARVNAAVHPVEPAESPTLSTGYKVGHHRIQGISDDFIPEIVKLDQLAAPIGVSDSCAIRMAQRLSRELGLGVGISSGANLLAAIEIIRRRGSGARVATVFCDNSLRYLSTALGGVEPERQGSIVHEVTFHGLRFIACPH
jgi:cysteine synthase